MRPEVSVTSVRPGPAPAPSDEPDARLRLPATVALVVGGIVGTGIFTAPAAVARYGWLTIPAFVIVGLGSLAVALSFAQLVRRTRRSGGPYVYADEAFGPFAGFLAAWTYWIQGWTGHATIAVAGAGYLASLLGAGTGRGTTLLLAAIILGLPVLNNLVSTRSVGAVAVVTTVLKITALTVVAIVGLVLFHPGNVGPVNAHGGNVGSALPAACALLLFSFLGMEGAAVATNRVEDPARNVPRAIVLGVVGVGVLYLAGTLAVQGTLPQDTLANSSAPFADAARELFGGAWAGKVIAAVAVLSALGSLNGWNMVNAEMVAGASRDGFFPPVFARRTRGLPVLALLVNSGLAFALILLNAAGNVLSLFTTLALLSTFVYVFGYVLSVAAQLLHALLEGGERPAAGPVATGVVALAFSIWMAGAAGPSAVRAGTVMVLIGIPAYVLTRWRAAARAASTP
ncbi:MAG: basic amino acid/polyamine antiporter, family [Baekduia sp.]|jgi:APA family basic amino acid/polyamine antiporter|nr:basic amino acid/polyamine antiporter, family [Baekduia sp.]